MGFATLSTRATGKNPCKNTP